jgi:hypothetical protein
MNDEEKDFWDNVGSYLEHKTLLVNALSMCENNKVISSKDLTVIDIHKACDNLKLRHTDLEDMSKAQIFCEECGMICPVIIPDHEKIFKKPDSKKDDVNELDEFLERAGTLTDSFYDDDDTSFMQDESDDWLK